MPKRARGLTTSGDGVGPAENNEADSEMKRVSEMKQWADGQTFSTDAVGAEQLLDAAGTQVMMEWERPYMVRCVDEMRLTSQDSVLEIGFGCGYSAERIQAASPRSHTIIECAEPVLARLRDWARHRPSVRVVEGTWQAVLPSLGRLEAPVAKSRQ